MEYTVGFIGTGNMAGAIIGGILKNGLLQAGQIAVCDHNPEKFNRYGALGSGRCLNACDLVKACSYVFLSVKPQNFAALLEEIKPVLSHETVLISIAAGISADFIKESLGFDAKVICAMPNTPLLIGCGATALSSRAPVTEAEFTFAKSLFECAGAVEEIAPDKMNEVIPLNGSSPAYIYLFAKIFVEQAVAAGFDIDTANRLFCHALIGSARMMLETGKNHQELIDMVTSPKGTTFVGLEALHRNGFEKALKECFSDTIRRAYELGK